MGTIADRISDKLLGWLPDQHIFFVATAPLGADGRVNLSPKGMSDTFAVIDERTVAYLDLTGSGIETVAHVRENSRITVMFCSFDERPNIVRLYGRGSAVQPGEAAYEELLKHFPRRDGVRAIIRVDVERVSESCGWGVPRMEFLGERDIMDVHRFEGS